MQDLKKKEMQDLNEVEKLISEIEKEIQTLNKDELKRLISLVAQLKLSR